MDRSTIRLAPIINQIKVGVCSDFYHLALREKPVLVGQWRRLVVGLERHPGGCCRLGVLLVLLWHGWRIV